MSILTEYNYQDREEWNRIVRSFKNYDVFYLNEYVTAFMKEDPENGIPLLLLYESGNDRAMNVVFRRDVAKDKKFQGKIEEDSYFDLITPYGYGGFWGNVENWDDLNKTYHKYCQENGYICEFVRFELFSTYRKYYAGDVETRTHNVVRNLEIPLDDIWMDFKQKVRKNVKRATKNGLQIIVENTNEHLKDFLDIYYSTMDRCDAQNSFFFSKDFFEEITLMNENIMYFYAVYDEKVVSAELVIYGSENCYSYLGGTNSEYFSVRPNDFLKYEIIKWAKEKGLKNFVLGGGYGSDDGIFQYKTCLAPKGIVDFYIGKKIFAPAIYQQLVNLRSAERPSCSSSDFFPQYRV